MTECNHTFEMNNATILTQTTRYERHIMTLQAALLKTFH